MHPSHPLFEIVCVGIHVVKCSDRPDQLYQAVISERLQIGKIWSCIDGKRKGTIHIHPLLFYLASLC